MRLHSDPAPKGVWVFSFIYVTATSNGMVANQKPPFAASEGVPVRECASHVVRRAVRPAPWLRFPPA